MEIPGKTFVVTGGANGIGRAVVQALLERGANVAAVDLSEQALAAAAESAGTDRLSTHALDITDASAVEALPEQVLALHGTVDGVVNVAGIIQRFVPIADLDVAEMAKVLEVNFWGTVRMTKAFLPHLMARPHAAVVNVGSMGGLVPVPGQSAYGASKAAVQLFTEGLYAEMQGTNVAVTMAYPGATNTDIAQHSDAAIPGRDAESSKAAANMTSPAEAARLIVDGIEKGSYRVLIGRDTKMLDALSRIAPKRATEMVASRMKDLVG
ncbi:MULTISPECIES: SDR family NAD(P)-dependent oxidoreductase [unclassified Pseudactinotalea]|uniref:SDR family NAD(P)-dependent oxidoreductase n=1 Tax=Micrococcales TaxID=85006 RepID=UPI003C7EAE5D